MTDYFIWVDQKILEWSIKIVFLTEVKTAKYQVLNLSVVSWALAQMTQSGALFSSLTIDNLVGLKWYLNFSLICDYLISKKDKHFF